MKKLICLLAAAALEQGISAQETYECTGSIEVGGHVYRCAYGAGPRTVDMKTALEQSCNCYFVQLGLRLGAQTVYDITKSAGLGKASRLRAVCGQIPLCPIIPDPGPEYNTRIVKFESSLVVPCML